MSKANTSSLPSSKNIINIIVVIALVAMVSSLATYVVMTMQSNKPLQQSYQQSLYPSPSNAITNWKIYSDANNKIVLQYPPTFTLGKTADAYIPPYNLLTLVVALHKDGFKDAKTQYSQEGFLTISKSDDTKGCYAGESAAQKIILADTVFHLTKVRGAALGHSIFGNMYRTVKGNTCFELETVIETQTGSGEGLDALQNQISQGEQQMQTDFNQILKTFAFMSK